MKEFSENIALRFGLKEAIIAQHLWELGADMDNKDVVFVDSKLWVRASATAIVNAHPYLTKHQVRNAISRLRSDHILLKRELNELK